MKYFGCLPAQVGRAQALGAVPAFRRVSEAERQLLRALSFARAALPAAECPKCTFFSPKYICNHLFASLAVKTRSAKSERRRLLRGMPFGCAPTRLGSCREVCVERFYFGGAFSGLKARLERERFEHVALAPFSVRISPCSATPQHLNDSPRLSVALPCSSCRRRGGRTPVLTSPSPLRGLAAPPCSFSCSRAPQQAELLPSSDFLLSSFERSRPFNPFYSSKVRFHGCPRARGSHALRILLAGRELRGFFGSKPCWTPS